VKVVYIAHPLSGDWAGNTAAARTFCEAAARSGYAPVAPYLTLDGLLVEPDDRDLGLEIDLAMIARCDEMWLCGPRESIGMAIERREAERLGLPVLRWAAVTDERVAS
jgi:hypothetical protein